MSTVVKSTQPLGFPWQTDDPFLFCAYHDDAYPRGNDVMGPDASLAGRNIGQDFAGIDGWRMYHGDVVPGFPRHPHRGFETITVLNKGYCDHSDSLGATARFGPGDAQWMTAGRGIVHSEMFPLRRRDASNPLELFQIWLNLPARSKMVDPHFTMLWERDIPKVEHPGVRITAVTGSPDGTIAPTPPDSWAADPANEVAVWTIELEPGASYTIPAASDGVNRSLYFHRGQSVKISGRKLPSGTRAIVEGAADIELVNGPEPAALLMLQGRPIREPVAHYGPFVMNNRAQLRQAFADYQTTGFGGWPWKEDGPVHARDQDRFAVHASGKEEAPA